MGFFKSGRGVSFSMSPVQFKSEENMRSASLLYSIWVNKFPQIVELDFNRPEDDDIPMGELQEMSVVMARLAIIYAGTKMEQIVGPNPHNKDYARIIDFGFYRASQFNFEAIEKIHRLSRALIEESYWDGTAKEVDAKKMLSSWKLSHPEFN